MMRVYEISVFYDGYTLDYFVKADNCQSAVSFLRDYLKDQDCRVSDFAFYEYSVEIGLFDNYDHEVIKCVSYSDSHLD